MADDANDAEPLRASNKLRYRPSLPNILRPASSVWIDRPSRDLRFVSNA